VGPLRKGKRDPIGHPNSRRQTATSEYVRAALAAGPIGGTGKRLPSPFSTTRALPSHRPELGIRPSGPVRPKPIVRVNPIVRISPDMTRRLLSYPGTTSQAVCQAVKALPLVRRRFPPTPGGCPAMDDTPTRKRPAPTSPPQARPTFFSFLRERGKMLLTHPPVPVDRGSVGLGLFIGPYPLKNPSLYVPPGWHASRAVPARALPARKYKIGL